MWRRDDEHVLHSCLLIERVYDAHDLRCCVWQWHQRQQYQWDDSSQRVESHPLKHAVRCPPNHWIERRSVQALEPLLCIWDNSKSRHQPSSAVVFLTVRAVPVLLSLTTCASYRSHNSISGIIPARRHHIVNSRGAACGNTNDDNCKFDGLINPYNGQKESMVLEQCLTLYLITVL